MSDFTDFLLLWLRPENFWILLGTLLIYYLRMMKPIMEKTNAILDRYALSPEEIEQNKINKIRHYELVNLNYKTLNSINDKMDKIITR